MFKSADYTATGETIPISVPYSVYDPISSQSTYLNPSRLTRWGSNGLAFRTAVGVFSVRSNVVKDLSSVAADLGVTASASGATATGSNTTYTFKVTNAGPSAAQDVALNLQVPSTGVFASATTTAGSCSAQTAGCNLGSIASGASVTVTIAVLETSAGTATATGTVTASTTDSNAADNSATASATVTGDTYNLQPVLTSVTPNAIKSGSADTTITLSGANFSTGSKVMLGSTALTTSYVSATKLTATVPSANLAAMGWSSLSVASPAPGGGNSNAATLTVYSVLSLGANRMVYDAYSRKLMVAVSTGSSAIAANSLVAVTPELATIGTPVTLPVTPTRLALSSTGQTLYAANSTATKLTRYNMLTGDVDTGAVALSPLYPYYTPYVIDLAVQPGSENTLSLSFGNYLYDFGIFDYSQVAKTYAQRPTYVSNYYSPTCQRFLDANNLFFYPDSSSAMNYFGVGANGLTSTTAKATSLGRFNCFKLANGNAYAGLGGVAALASGGSVTQLGSFTLPKYSLYGTTAGSLLVEPDASLKTVFFAANTGTYSYGTTDGLLSFDMGTYLRTGTLPLNMSTIEGSTNYSISDIFRWGQDGLALLTSTGHIYLLRGPFVVPQLLNTNSAAVLSSSATTTVAAGSGNMLLTLTGSNFIPGVAVTWNGSYRTTTIVDATHVTVAIPASELATAGTGKLVATNPGATASAAVTVMVQ